MRLCLSLGLLVGQALLSVFSLGQASPSKNSQEATISSAPAAQVFPPPADYKFPSGQTYIYAVEWHLFNAGTATVGMSFDGSQYRVTATAESAGVVNTLYKVHDHFEATLDPRTFCSLSIKKHAEEGPHKRDTMVKFDYAHKKALLEEKNLKTGEQKQEQNDIPGCITDVITGFYYLASLPLQPGYRTIFPINGGGKTTMAEAKVESRERIKVPAGTYQTVRVQVEAISGALQSKGSVLVWYTDDANHTPVQMRSKLGWGTLLFRLQRIEKSN
jgi:hypothetical protein